MPVPLVVQVNGVYKHASGNLLLICDVDPSGKTLLYEAYEPNKKEEFGDIIEVETMTFQEFIDGNYELLYIRKT